MFLVCHVIKQDQVIKVSSKLWPVKATHYPTKFGGHRHSVSGDIKIFVCHVTFQNHLMKALYDFIVKSPLKYVTTLPSLVSIATVAV